MDEHSNVFLRMMAYSVPTAGGQLVVTLVVSGSIVSGTVIAAESYYERAASELAKSLDLRKPPAEMIAALQGIIKRGPKSTNDEPELGLYIYLKDVVILGPGGVKVAVPTWRGRKAHISGRNFGVPDYDNQDENGSLVGASSSAAD